MFGHSSLHAQFQWAKTRIDRMDKALAGLERQGSKLKARTKPAAKRLVADLKQRRARFETILKKQAQDSDKAWRLSRVQMEKEWKTFEARAGHALQRAVKKPA